jgi:type I restriction enzyme S subunit
MKVKHIPSHWLREDGRRFDCGPYMSGAREAKEKLARLSVRKDRLQQLTAGGMDGIINAGRIKRQWVDDPAYGVPFLSSSDILQADLSNLSLISNRVVSENPRLLIQPGWILVTRSGTIGRMVYARKDMEGMACSEDVMRILPSPGTIPGGYLYAFLSGKYGLPLITSGTYGAIIQHLEPHHIADLPVPRLGDDLEARVHALIEQAAHLRAEAALSRQLLIEYIETRLDWCARHLSELVSTANSRQLVKRMDAFHHTGPIGMARQSLSQSSETKMLADTVVEVFEPNRGARLKVETTTYGVPFLSSSEVFRLDPQGEYLISAQRTPNLERLLVRENDVLLPRSGQIGGIIGRAVLPLDTYFGQAASEHLVRIRCHERTDAYYIWAILASEPGYFSAIGTAYGSSIPSLSTTLLSELSIPWPHEAERCEVSQRVAAMVDTQVQAIRSERKAVLLVEQAIEEAA